MVVHVHGIDFTSGPGKQRVVSLFQEHDQIIPDAPSFHKIDGDYWILACDVVPCFRDELRNLIYARLQDLNPVSLNVHIAELPEPPPLYSPGTAITPEWPGIID